MNAVCRISPASADVGLLAWLNQAEPGDALEYHRGFPRARSLDANAGDERGRSDRALSVASLAMRLADRGLVDLVQRRIARDCFSYLAIARSRDCELSQILEAE